jgi:hypothetical protein
MSSSLGRRLPKPMPRFHIRDGFAIHDKSAFDMAGFVIEGDVSAGMSVQMPFSATVMMTAEIDHIQHVRRPDGDVVCLCIRCHPAEAVLWEALKIKDRTVNIIKADGN